MQKGRGVFVLVILGAIVLGVAVVEFMGRRGGTSPIGDTITTVVNKLDSSPRVVTPPPAPAPVVEKGRAAGPGAQRKPPAVPPAKSTPAPLPSVTIPPSVPRIPIPPATTVSKPARPPVSVPPVVSPRRNDTFIAGNRQSWDGYNITIDSPLLVRAGGVVRVGDVVAGPGGLAEGAIGMARGVKVIPAAPYLALIGRVCSTEECTAPFLIGSQSVLCPSGLGLSGDLQLWTNNYVQVDGYQTLNSYTRAAGGFRFQTDPVPDTACGDLARRVASTAVRTDGPPRLTPGEVLQRADYAVSSRQNAWKPFFLPLEVPLVIRATGDVQPHERTRGTGPGGIAVPAGERWTYPGSREVVVDADHVLIVPSLPYQSLIGRLCSASTCGEPFLVGAERTVCPHPDYNERLELWINHIVPRLEGLTVPFANLAFQGRRGEYRFDVIGAPAGACGK